MKGRKGQQYAARQDAIKITLERENREYTTTGLGKCFNYDGSTFGALSDTQILKFDIYRRLQNISKSIYVRCQIVPSFRATRRHQCKKFGYFQVSSHKSIKIVEILFSVTVIQSYINIRHKSSICVFNQSTNRILLFPFKLLHRKWNGEMRYIPNIRMKKIIKPTEINREVSQEKSDEQESLEVKQVSELEDVVSHENDSARSDLVSRGELQNTCFTDIGVE